MRAPTHEHHVNPWLVLVLVCMAQFMVVLDATIVNVALLGVALFALLFLLRREDVIAVGEGEAAIGTAAG